ncbi:hypothetical protein TSTA_109110 [Talaromyces stipitatus ATCC 10500]|uniref:C2H2-type domain-containing protein n=1 Tax=Talaromyces stipitatus (strain ATCC 10500 / CBS 375.48 / QM 6759 / NRRL 1006) TaxID=441959 RepID=B8MUW4_TALSN|nr:uncharacterized protein TSTA_109110 [Talaromyces stipitatus ATCC 10500]EED11732.1 hypothetical protein TSTA_109110 [Talaromyces stipitatus ATCC 10500]
MAYNLDLSSTASNAPSQADNAKTFPFQEAQRRYLRYGSSISKGWHRQRLQKSLLPRIGNASLSYSIEVRQRMQALPSQAFDPKSHANPAEPNIEGQYELNSTSGTSERQSQVRVLELPSKAQCWDHGCNGREFSTFSNFMRHQREKSGAATKWECPHCGAVFTRSTARNTHIAQVKYDQARYKSLITSGNWYCGIESRKDTSQVRWLRYIWETRSHRKPARGCVKPSGNARILNVPSSHLGPRPVYSVTAVKSTGLHQIGCDVSILNVPSTHLRPIALYYATIVKPTGLMATQAFCVYLSNVVELLLGGLFRANGIVTITCEELIIMLAVMMTSRNRKFLMLVKIAALAVGSEDSIESFLPNNGGRFSLLEGW